jgi:hypothetical protein
MAFEDMRGTREERRLFLKLKCGRDTSKSHMHSTATSASFYTRKQTNKHMYTIKMTRPVRSFRRSFFTKALLYKGPSKWVWLT